MKNQYFGDSRDYVEYDVLESLLTADPALEQITLHAGATRAENERRAHERIGSEADEYAAQFEGDRVAFRIDPPPEEAGPSVSE